MQVIQGSGRRGQLIESFLHILGAWGRGSGPRGEKMAAACRGVDSQVLATIMDPFRSMFVDVGSDGFSAT